MESQILISVCFSQEFGIMQKSLTIIIIKKFIMNFWNSFSLLQNVVVSLWPQISSSHTHPSQSQISPLFRECPPRRAFTVRKSTATEHSNICKSRSGRGGIHKRRRCLPFWELPTTRVDVSHQEPTTIDVFRLVYVEGALPALDFLGGLGFRFFKLEKI